MNVGTPGTQRYADICVPEVPRGKAGYVGTRPFRGVPRVPNPELSVLLEAAERCCDHHGDDEAARQQMRDDLGQVPPHQRGDLLDHFRREYGDPR